ncbi:HU family DNA-binding protein [Pseudovibrio ascidiaceicola]|uniref:HU family DNA-binding protein n=1 Tax=Pseudovibrio ascidiaceicola TaxID=285279 RepID=UPI003D36434F
MNKAELSARIAQELGIERELSRDFLEAFVDIARTELLAGRQIKIHNLCSIVPYSTTKGGMRFRFKPSRLWSEGLKFPPSERVDV